MDNNFNAIINEIYSIILEPIDIMYKITAINNYKKVLKIENNSSFGKVYLENLHNTNSTGVVYTPIEISNYMLENTILREDIINNPYIKIIDPACGCGNIIIPCYQHLKKLYNQNIEEINKKNKLSFKEDNISEHIICNNLFGMDIDETSIKILLIDMFSISGFVNKNNFKNEDYLFNKGEGKFDFIIGNPPYIGHKNVDKEYTKVLRKKYKEVLSDKGDISYCFIYKAINDVKANGKVTYITSRYFMEAKSGAGIRSTLSKKCGIYRITDFYGNRPFKGIGIDPVILFYKNSKNRIDNIEVIKPKLNNNYIKSKTEGAFFLLDSSKESFRLDSDNLSSEPWILKNEKELKIINKIINKSTVSLNELCDCYQGIITGCDKVFIVDDEAIKNENLETDILKPWLKNSQVEKNNIKNSTKYIIYTNNINDESKYINCLKHIEIQKERLLNRRECKRGIRKWYELQWGREQEIFENEKIVFPYKAQSNRFALDSGSYFSADIYCLRLKKDLQNNLNYTYNKLLFILNSKTYEFYFKAFAKKLGFDLYEYYPSNILKLRLPEKIEEFTEEKELFKYFNFSEEEISIINSQIKN